MFSLVDQLAYSNSAADYLVKPRKSQKPAIEKTQSLVTTNTKESGKCTTAFPAITPGNQCEDMSAEQDPPTREQDEIEKPGMDASQEKEEIVDAESDSSPQEANSKPVEGTNDTNTNVPDLGNFETKNGEKEEEMSEEAGNDTTESNPEKQQVSKMVTFFNQEALGRKEDDSNDYHRTEEANKEEDLSDEKVTVEQDMCTEVESKDNASKENEGTKESEPVNKEKKSWKNLWFKSKKANKSEKLKKVDMPEDGHSENNDKAEQNDAQSTEDSLPEKKSFRGYFTLTYDKVEKVWKQQNRDDDLASGVESVSATTDSGIGEALVSSVETLQQSTAETYMGEENKLQQESQETQSPFDHNDVELAEKNEESLKPLDNNDTDPSEKNQESQKPVAHNDTDLSENNQDGQSIVSHNDTNPFEENQESQSSVDHNDVDNSGNSLVSTNQDTLDTEAPTSDTRNEAGDVNDVIATDTKTTEEGGRSRWTSLWLNAKVKAAIANSFTLWREMDEKAAESARSKWKKATNAVLLANRMTPFREISEEGETVSDKLTQAKDQLTSLSSSLSQLRTQACLLFLFLLLILTFAVYKAVEINNRPPPSYLDFMFIYAYCAMNDILVNSV